MDAVLPLATLLVLWPSLLPRWRAMLVATLLLGLALAALMFIALDHLDRAAGGDGPAFFAVIALYALGQGLLLGACAARTLIQAGMARLSPRHTPPAGVGCGARCCRWDWRPASARWRIG